MPYGFIMRRKYFAGNFSACIITKSLTKVSMKHSLEASKVETIKPSNIINISLCTTQCSILHGGNTKGIF